MKAISFLWKNDVADPKRLKSIGTLNVDDVDDACKELDRCAKLGMVGVFIPAHPLADRPYNLEMYDPLWAKAQNLEMPLLLHIATNRGGIPGCEFTMNLSELSPVGRSTTDHWVRCSLTAMTFGGVFDRFPRPCSLRFCFKIEKSRNDGVEQRCGF